METLERKHVHPKYLTVPQFCKAHIWATPGGIRHLIFHGETNGFKKCVRRMGRRILLDEDAIFRWIEERDGVPFSAKDHVVQP